MPGETTYPFSPLPHITVDLNYIPSFFNHYYYFYCCLIRGIETLPHNRGKKFPIHGIIGLMLVLLFWYLNWSLSGLRTHWGFFPLWLGFCLSLDAAVYYLKGESLLSRSYKEYILLFIISAPTWWLFEIFNLRMQNWYYDGQENFTYFEFFILASISFSTVIPAVFTAAEFTKIFITGKSVDPENITSPGNKILVILLLSGIAILLLILIFPDYFYFLIWIAFYFIFDPINVWRGNPNLIVHYINKNYRPLFVLGSGALVCGFFWEMWNYYSYPKWEYYLPMVNFLHVFEMPLLGYIGYIPFALELYAFYNFIYGFLGKKRIYIRI